MRKGMRVEESSHVVHPTSTVRVWWYCQWITGMNTLCVYNSCFCPSSPYTVTVVDLPFMKPNCSPLHIMFTVSRRWCSSTLSYIFMLYVAQWAYVSVISTAHAWCPLVLKQDASSPFITHQSSSAPFNDFVKVSEFCRTSLQLVPRQSRHFQASAGKLSDPTAFPFFIFPSALSTSSDVIGLYYNLSCQLFLYLLLSSFSWVLLIHEILKVVPSSVQDLTCLHIFRVLIPLLCKSHQHPPDPLSFSQVHIFIQLVIIGLCVCSSDCLWRASFFFQA